MTNNEALATIPETIDNAPDLSAQVTVAGLARDRVTATKPYVDEVSGRNIIVTGLETSGLPHTSFEPVDPKDVLIPYNQ